jgi:hypothetical protein
VKVTTARVTLHAYATSALLLGATLYPALLPPHDDGFPLSTYPMFATEKPKRVAVMSALALGDGGVEHALSPGYIANAEAMQALQTLKKSVAAGKRSARALCDRIAARVAERAEPELARARHVAIVTQEHDAVAYLTGDEQALSRTVHVRCKVPATLEVGR